MKSKLCEKVCYRKTVIKTVLNNMFFVIGITAISHSQYDGSAQGYVWVILSPEFFYKLISYTCLTGNCTIVFRGKIVFMSTSTIVFTK